MALRLFEVHMAGSPQMRLQDDIHMHPYTHIMAVMIVAVKLLYGLDVEPCQIGKAQAPAAVDWQAWAEAVVKRSRGPVQFPKTAAEVQSDIISLMMAHGAHVCCVISTVEHTSTKACDCMPAFSSC